MNKLPLEQETEEEKDRVVKLKVIEGGRTAREGGPTETNWLLELPEGAIFLVKEKASTNPVLQELELLQKHANACKLYSDLNQEIYFWVDPYDFCRKHSKVKVLNDGSSD